MSKFSLEVEEDFDFFMLGICSHIKDYRLCWEINRLLDVGLKKDNDLEILINGESRAYAFSLDEGGESPNDYYLISNKCGLGFLVPEEKKFDYFLIVKGPLSENEEKNMIKLINKSKNVLTTLSIEAAELRSKNNLIF